MNKSTTAQQAESANFSPPARSLLNRKCACGNKTIASVECTACSKQKNSLQRPLTIGASNSIGQSDNKPRQFPIPDHNVAPMTHDFCGLQAFPVRSSMARGDSFADIPASGAPGEEIVDQPLADGGSTVTPATADSNSCGQPRSMHKQISGAFLGGLTMDSYYPDLAGGGAYSHPGTNGTFDTGSRAGANVQLYGVIPSPCSPNQFHLEQTITRTRLRRNGVRDRTEGTTVDDIAKSGRDATRPPFRQEFLGGGTAPLGYIISMADPPSTGYNSGDNIEHDRNFVTSLVGPSGRQSVSWSLSTRISGGTVTSNVLT